MHVILLFPGQGSQKPGMGKELVESFPAARDVFAQVDDALNTPISRLCFEGPAEELTQTHNAQPALFAHGAAAWAVVRDALAPYVVAAAGHSLGEHTAYHAAGSVSVVDGARIVRRRGEAMYQAGMDRPGSMAAILGLHNRPIDEICAQATSEAGLVVAANYNTDEQTVISGEVAGVERAMVLAKEAGAKRAVPLAVSGAFHSPLMAPAEPALAEVIESATFTDPSFPVYANVTAEACSNAADAKALLRQQLTAPVRWAESIRRMTAMYPGALYVELGPGNVLRGLVGRLVHGTHALACGTPAEIDDVLAHVKQAITQPAHI